MLIGELEKDLPEARRGFNFSDTIDRWPFIFKELHKAGYKTLYTEDNPKYSTFNFRLNGFSKQPTTKYARPYWMASKNDDIFRSSPTCVHEIALKYAKDFLKSYVDQQTFSFVVSGKLAHELNYVAQLVDRDGVEFFEFLESNKQRENSIVIMFGDHGDRTSKARTTMTGKLEERLPFMSFSFPIWFKKKYPIEFLNFRRNAHVLTSHFDIYATLKHLLTFPVNKFSHNRGKSLFTDVVSLNRTCSDVGVKEHWCSCLHYEKLDNSGALAEKLAKQVVNVINGKNYALKFARDNCETLELKTILHVRKMIPNKAVQKFSKTFRDDKCDECGVKESDDLYKVANYEIVFDVSPSNGIYETSVVFDENVQEVTVSKEISRLNLYGKQPDCVAKQFPFLRKFCFCKTS